MKRPYPVAMIQEEPLKRRCALTCVLVDLVPHILDASNFELSNTLSLVNHGYNIRVQNCCLSEILRHANVHVDNTFLMRTERFMLVHAVRAALRTNDLEHRKSYLGVLLRVPSNYFRIRAIYSATLEKPVDARIVTYCERQWRHLRQDHFQRIQYIKILFLGQEYFLDHLFEDLCHLMCIDRLVPSFFRLQMSNLPVDHMENQKKFYHEVFPEFDPLVQRSADILLHMIRLWCPDGKIPNEIWKINSKYHNLTGANLVGRGFDRSKSEDIPGLVEKDPAYIWTLVLLKERLGLGGRTMDGLIEAWSLIDARISEELENIRKVLDSFTLGPFSTASLDDAKAKQLALYLVEMSSGLISAKWNDQLIAKYLDCTDLSTSLFLEGVITRCGLVYWTHQTIAMRMKRTAFEGNFFRILPFCMLANWRYIVLDAQPRNLEMLIWKDVYDILGGNKGTIDDYSAYLTCDLIEPLVKIIVKHPDYQMIGDSLSSIFPQFSEQFSAAFFLYSKK